MHRTANRQPVPPPPRGRAHWAWLAALCCALLAAACSGGSGSSGFDLALLRENRAIDDALAEQTCEMNEGLIICPSGMEALAPTATMAMPESSPTPMPTPPALGTATRTASPASVTATVPPTTATPTARAATASPTPSFTPLPPMAPNVDTNVGPDETISCALGDGQNPCLFLFTFEPSGLPSAAAYRVAVRTRDPDSNWSVLPVVDNTALIEIDTAPGAPGYQIAVLVYEEDPPFVPDQVELLADSGADYAFVTAVLSAQSP